MGHDPHEQHPQGAFICPPDLLGSLIEFECRRMGRHGRPTTVILFEHGSSTEGGDVEPHPLDVLELHLRASVRRADVLCRVDRDRLALMCVDTDETRAGVLIQRLMASGVHDLRGIMDRVQWRMVPLRPLPDIGGEPGDDGPVNVRSA